MVSGRWNDAFMGIVMGLLTYIVVDELIDAFEIGGTDAPASEKLIADLVPFAIAIMVVVFAFRGLM